MNDTSSFELLLRQALSPVEPPEDLRARLEGTLLDITASAVEELEAWELSAMRDPRNWLRPAAAVVIGGAAGGALVLVRARRASRPPSGLPAVRDALGRGAGELRKRANRLRGS